MNQRDFREMYDVYSRDIYNYVSWTLHDRDSAQDVLQTVFIKVWDHGGGPSDPQERRRWLFTVARNACTDYFRSAARHSLFHSRLRFEYETMDENREAGSPGVWEILSALSDTDRSILYLHLRAGYSYAEIGQILSLAETNVRVRAFRALRQLRKLYTKE